MTVADDCDAISSTESLLSGESNARNKQHKAPQLFRKLGTSRQEAKDHVQAYRHDAPRCHKLKLLACITFECAAITTLAANWTQWEHKEETTGYTDVYMMNLITNWYEDMLGKHTIANLIPEVELAEWRIKRWSDYRILCKFAADMRQRLVLCTVLKQWTINSIDCMEVTDTLITMAA